MPRTREEILAEDVRDLARLGYAQQLFREMGGFSNFAISFSIISILTGAVLLYGYGLKFAGPIVNTVGWPVVSLFTLTVAASMAELASAYPTAGGLYYWAFRLGGRGWAWLTAWLNMMNWGNRRRGRGEFTTPATAPWSLGRWGSLVNVIAIVWVGFIAIVFTLPPNELVLWTMVLVAVLLALSWGLSARRRFVGPVRTSAPR